MALNNVLRLRKRVENLEQQIRSKSNRLLIISPKEHEAVTSGEKTLEDIGISPNCGMIIVAPEILG